ncbi:hypothetical protein METSCH_C04740 [Metschnikowia aff. pulcherrima]|uniref:Long chronological lifespan protein 2 n=1 Tax=Metschnikowia aff. pulcherrima TaxID=2163413 RepID=A0A4P6XPC6_9ASCO|nr:hypothetical protein METSCH_C04740 [Metschnikowia aff. pulcherrima]
MRLFAFLTAFAVASANIFDFFNQQQQQQQQQPASFEEQALESRCSAYLCPDTLSCAAAPNECPCPYPSSQLRCVLPNKQYVCISKPAGNYNGDYDEPTQNWKMDAKDDLVHDCGWVNRAWQGRI